MNIISNKKDAKALNFVIKSNNVHRLGLFLQMLY